MKAVDGGPCLGADSGTEDGSVEMAQCSKNIVEKSDSVFSLNFENGRQLFFFVTQKNSLRDVEIGWLGGSYGRLRSFFDQVSEVDMADVCTELFGDEFFDSLDLPRGI